MKTALLHSGSVVSADDYDKEKHGTRLYCIDKGCGAPVSYVHRTPKMSAHFKTTGKGDSKHRPGCGFYEPLTCVEAIEKVGEYQSELLDVMPETVIRLNMNRIDPDYEPKTVERESKNDEEEKSVKVKNDRDNPDSIGSVKSVVKLMTEYEPDLLASIIFNVGGGRKVPLSDLVISQKKAHERLWTGDRNAQKMGYFVYGTVKNLKRLEKVIYVNFEVKDEIPFTLVVFERYFPHFTYRDEDLIGSDVLVYGFLRKNEYENKQQTEMLIKSDKNLEIIQKN